MSEDSFKVTLQGSHEKLFVLPGKLLLAWDAKKGSEVYIDSKKEGTRIKVEEPRAELAERFNLLSFGRYGWLQRPFSIAPSALINWVGYGDDVAFLTTDIGGVERKFTVRPDEMRAYAGRLDFAEFLRSDRQSSIAVNPAFVAAVRQVAPDLTHVMFKHPAKWIAGVPGSAQDAMRHIANKSGMRPPGF